MTLSTKMNKMRAVLNTRIVPHDALSPMSYAANALTIALLDPAETKLVQGALVLARSDVLFDENTKEFYFLFVKNDSGYIFKYADKYVADLNKVNPELGVKLHGHYFFEKNGEEINSSDDFDTVKYARFSFKVVDLLNAALLLSENDLVSGMMIDCQLDVNDDWDGKLDFGEVYVRRLMGGCTTSVVFKNAGGMSMTHFNADFNLSESICWTSDEGAPGFRYPEVSINIHKNGSLVFMAGSSGFAGSVFLKEMSEHDSIKHLDHDFIAMLIHETGFYTVQPEWIGALTDAPIVTDEAPNYEDDGTVTFSDEARFWWYPNYAVVSFGQELIENGETIFSSSLQENKKIAA